MAIIKNQNTKGFPKNRCLQAVGKMSAVVRAVLYQINTSTHVLFIPLNSDRLITSDNLVFKVRI